MTGLNLPPSTVAEQWRADAPSLPDALTALSEYSSSVNPNEPHKILFEHRRCTWHEVYPARDLPLAVLVSRALEHRMTGCRS